MLLALSFLIDVIETCRMYEKVRQACNLSNTLAWIRTISPKPEICFASFYQQHISPHDHLHKDILESDNRFTNPPESSRDE